MSGITIGWNEATPANTDLVGTFDDVLRSTKSNVQGALNAEHVWSSSSGTAGEHRAGSARVFVGTKSAVSSADTDGRYMIASDASRLYYVGSDASTYRVGGSLVPTVRSAITDAAVTRTLSLNSVWKMSFLTMSMNTYEASQGVWTYTAGGAAMAWAQVDHGGTGSEVPCRVTVDLDGSTGGVPVVNLWNPDGSFWSGATQIVHLMILSTESR